MESEEAHARVDGEWDESEAERLDIDASDAETSFKLAHKRSLGAARMEFGIDYRTKKREIDHTYYEFAAENEGDPVAYELDTTIGSLIEETRIDPYLMFSGDLRSEEHTSELQSLMRISYAVFCLKKKKTKTIHKNIK